MYSVRCPKCKKIYQFDGLPPKWCPECLMKEEAEYSAVREYVKAHPGVNIYVTSQETGTPVTKILQYLREERLEISDRSTTFLKCASCGKYINTGVYCDECKRRFGETANSSIGKVPTDPAKMRIALQIITHDKKDD